MKLHEQLRKACECGIKEVLICGDFNHRSINWNTLNAGSNDESFLQLTQNLFLTQHVEEPTRGENTLDLVLTTNPDAIENLKVTIPLAETCDHNMIEFDLKCRTTKKLWKTKYYDYRNADYEGMKKNFEKDGRR